MTYEELVAKVKDATKKARVSKIVGHVAFQFNVEGEGEGAFYLEISEGKVYVEPYEYYDRDLLIITTAEIIMQMIEGNLLPMEALTNNRLRVYGDERLIEVLPFGCECKKKAERKCKASI